MKCWSGVCHSNRHSAVVSRGVAKTDSSNSVLVLNSWSMLRRPCDGCSEEYICIPVQRSPTRECPHENGISTRHGGCSFIHREVEVAIIGNGPAAIFLSFVLSGYWPYFTGTHPDEYLRQKLSEHPERSVLEQDLLYLSDGLQGRSHNPVAVLFDTLMRPNADIGEEHPPSLRWEYHPSKAVPHVVLGDGEPGGSWHNMQPDIQTLSLASWLELPNFCFQDWKLSESAIKESATDQQSTKRALVGDVAKYYSDYVTKMGLESNFLNGVDVTQVTERRRTCRAPSSPASPSPISSVSSSSSLHEDPLLQGHVEDSCMTEKEYQDVQENGGICLEFLAKDEKIFTTQVSSREASTDPECYISDTDDVGVFSCGAQKCSKYKWYLRGAKSCCGGEHAEGENVSVAAKKVVLACGVDGTPRRLSVPGEDSPYVKHRFSDFLPSLDALEDSPHPLLIVGDGLTAADAILIALSRKVKVVHAFYHDPSDTSLIYRKLSPKTYKEYCYVSNLMQGKETNANYVPLVQHRVCKFDSNGATTIRDRDGVEKVVPVLLAMVLIGSEAELGFLPQEIVSRLGGHPDKPIHHKHNPVAVDSDSFECVSVPSLYALGPLVGDNFVRFVLGSALGAAQSLSNTDIA